VYQLRVPPGQPAADKLTTPVPHRVSFVTVGAVGNGFTVTVTVAVLVHPVAVIVPVTVYVVVAVGLAVTVVPVVEDNPVEGLHE
jgi:hypothetical protein